MKLGMALLFFAGLALAKPQPQLPTPQSPPPPLSSHLPTGAPPVSPTLPPIPGPPTSTSKGGPPPPPASDKPGPNGPICECGYTYCASVLMAMSTSLLSIDEDEVKKSSLGSSKLTVSAEIPWSQKQLGDAYCSTPHATCLNNAPSTNVTSALYLCLCDDIDQKVGNTLHLICGCETCLNIAPDFRGRCDTPCHAGK